MFYVNSKKVDDDKVLKTLEDVVCLEPQDFSIRSQARTCTEAGWLPSVDEELELTYDWERHGFVVPSETLEHVSQILEGVSYIKGVN